MPENVGVIFTAPRPSDLTFDPEPERSEIEARLGRKVILVTDPSLDELAVVAQTTKGSIVHIAGVGDPSGSEGPATVWFEADDGSKRPETGTTISEKLQQAAPYCLVLSVANSSDLIGDITACPTIGVGPEHSDLAGERLAARFYEVIARRAGSGSNLEQVVIEAREASGGAAGQFTLASAADRIGRLAARGGDIRDRLSSEGTWLVIGRRRDVFVAQAPTIGTSDFTVIAWMRRRATQIQHGYFADTRASDSSPGWVMGGYKNGLLFQINSGNSHINYWSAKKEHGEYVLAGTVIFDGEWHLVAASLDRDGHCELSIDGRREHGGDSHFPDVDLSGSSLLIGTAGDHKDDPSHHFNGELADLAVIQRTVSIAELAELYRVGPSGGR